MWKANITMKNTATKAQFTGETLQDLLNIIDDIGLQEDDVNEIHIYREEV